ncbi:MAG: hypothetical protein ACK4WH_13105 [Phycisphaerales bacterium]
MNVGAKAIISHVESVYRHPIAEFGARGILRTRHRVKARHVAIYALRLAGYSLSDIAASVGLGSHTSIYQALRSMGDESMAEGRAVYEAVVAKHRGATA